MRNKNSIAHIIFFNVFSYLEYPKQDELARNLTNGDARNILADLTPDDRTSLLEELPAEVTQRLLTLLSPEDLREARTLLGYPEESVGRLMTPDHVAIRAEWTIQEAPVRFPATRRSMILGPISMAPKAAVLEIRSSIPAIPYL